MSIYDDILLKQNPQTIFGLTDEMIAAQYPMLPAHKRATDRKEYGAPLFPVPTQQQVQGIATPAQRESAAHSLETKPTDDPKEMVGNFVKNMVSLSLIPGQIGTQLMPDITATLMGEDQSGDIAKTLGEIQMDIVKQAKSFAGMDERGFLTPPEESAKIKGEAWSKDPGYGAAIVAPGLKGGRVKGLTTDVFYSEAERAVDKIPFPKVNAFSLPKLLRKYGAEPIELKALGIDELVKENPKREFTKEELKQYIQDKGIKLGEDVYAQRNREWLEDDTKWNKFVKDQQWTWEADEGLGKPYSQYTVAERRNLIRQIEDETGESFIPDEKSKSAQYATHQAIKSQEGVIPDSYTEEFVTAELAKKNFNLDAAELELRQVSSHLEDIDHDMPLNISNVPLDLLRERGLLQNRQIELRNNIKEMRESSSWKDPHSSYSETQNPIGRFRYDVVEHPNGRKTMRVQEIQQGFDKESSKQVPEAFRDPVKSAGKNAAGSDVLYHGDKKWQDVVVKKAIARAKELGLDGIEWSTGEQQRDLYNSALRQVADEARYNPETGELHILKNGSPVQGYPQKVPVEKIEEHIGKDAAQRLMENSSDIELPKENDWKLGTDDDSGLSDWKYKDYQIIDFNNVPQSSYAYELYQGYTKLGLFDSLGAAKQHAVKIMEESDRFDNSKKGLTPNMHRLTDLSMDAQWPGKLYGDFSNTESRYNVEYKHNSGSWEVDRDSGEDGAFNNLKSKEEAEKAMQSLIDDGYKPEELRIAKSQRQSFGDFNYNATVPKLLKKYGKGEFGVSDAKSNVPGFKEFETNMGKKWNIGDIYIAEKKNYGGYTDFGDKIYTVYDKEGMEIETFGSISVAKSFAEQVYKSDIKETNSQQPVMWFTKDTPSQFPIYEGVTGIFRMLQEEISKEGGGAKGVSKVALKYGLPAGALAYWLKADDETKKKMLITPMFAALGVKFGEKMPFNIEGVKLPRPRRFKDMEYYGIDPNDKLVTNHASPHAFDETNIYDNLGKGQGARAYGEGMYSSTSEGVHKSYVSEFLKRAPITIGDEYAPKNVPASLINKTVEEALDLINRGLIASGPTSHLIKRAIQGLVDDGTVVSGISTSGATQTPYYLVRESSMIRPVITEKGNMVISLGDSEQYMLKLFEKYGFKEEAKIIKEKILDSRRNKTRDITELIFKKAPEIDKMVKEVQNKLPKDKFYFDPEIGNAYVEKEKGVWKLKINNYNVLKDKYKVRYEYNSPEEAIQAYKNFPRVKQRGVQDIETLKSDLQQFLKDKEPTHKIERKTPQYKLESMPQATYMDHDKPITEQHPYIQDRIKAVLETLYPEIDLINQIKDGRQTLTGIKAYDLIASKVGGRVNASRYLNSIGVAGFRYPAVGGRNYEKPNYVHFYDPDIIESNVNKKKINN